MSFLDSMAKKAFEKEDIQQSWRVHLQAFGPILEPAFREDYASRIHLTAALGRISRNDIRGGLDKLMPLRKALKNDADRAAWLFFLGLAFEQAGDIRNTLECYQQANAYEHRFYLPYLKVARYAYEDMAYEASARNYRKAISCFDGTGLGEQEKTIVASAYTNLASCLTLMHRFDEAHQALDTSRQIVPDAAGRLGTEAILYAAQGKQTQAQQCLDQLEQSMPDSAAAVHEAVDPILNGSNPHFFLQPIDSDKLDTFWNWFSRTESSIREQIQKGEGENALQQICDQLHLIFPFLDRAPWVGYQKEEKDTLILEDYFSVSLESGYRQLLACRPESINQIWNFIHQH